MKTGTYKAVNENLKAIIALANTMDYVIGEGFENVGMTGSADKVRKYAKAFRSIAQDIQDMIAKDTRDTADEYFSNMFNTLNCMADQVLTSNNSPKE